VRRESGVPHESEGRCILRLQAASVSTPHSLSGCCAPIDATPRDPDVFNPFDGKESGWRYHAPSWPTGIGSVLSLGRRVFPNA
jgi:hypothetical protein